MLLAVASLCVAFGLNEAPAPSSAPTLGKPAPVFAGSKPINVDVGHAAPFLADIDEDGKPELLVGQFGDGKLRIYRNTGSANEPRFEKFTWFQAGGRDGSVPSG